VVISAVQSCRPPKTGPNRANQSHVPGKRSAYRKVKYWDGTRHLFADSDKLQPIGVPLRGSRVFVLAPSPVPGVQPACAVAMAATSRSCAPCTHTRSTLFPIVSVESAAIDSDASLACDNLCTLTVNEVWSV
jgi:hypothetical protein